MKRHLPHLWAALLAASALSTVSCANFRKLGKDLKLLKDDYRINGIITNADSFRCPVRASVVEWDKEKGKVFSGDRLDLTDGGAFMFLVKSPLNQHVVAYADENRSGVLDDGEPIWLHRGADGQPAAVQLNAEKRTARVRGELGTGERMPAAMREAIARLLAGRKVEEVINHQGIRFALGERAGLDDPRFAATRGEDGLWTPATFAIKSGFGIYFLERHDPAKTPVIFIHGAAGSPQDWREAMEKIDRDIYQPWFYVYPSGMRLEAAATALDDGVKLLHDRYGFKRLHVVAHSMGGLVARRFVIRNTLEGRNTYINTLITFSSPWDGHEAAAMGVKYAPQVVPSWRDMAHGSDFLTHLYDRRLKGTVSHHLFYSHHASRSRILPPENDGTVSVASQLRKEAKNDAVQVLGFDEDHVSILSSNAALKAGKKILDQAPR
jgi:pimeloyl-ACP methyl ester carboxylesterase